MCKPGQFRCLDGKKCINSTWTCEGVNDCGDNSDEKDCAGKSHYNQTWIITPNNWWAARWVSG